ncbi:MAG: hypothetical protein CM1200mP35_05810 [Chloroflexota bacterium]|nr:MAG: hypothetical protein CM1200mP35_05810 [Chloroflexota bacterium]
MDNQNISLVDSLERSNSILTKDEVVNLDEKDREMLRFNHSSRCFNREGDYGPPARHGSH